MRGVNQVLRLLRLVKASGSAEALPEKRFFLMQQNQRTRAKAASSTAAPTATPMIAAVENSEDELDLLFDPDPDGVDGARGARGGVPGGGGGAFRLS